MERPLGPGVRKKGRNTYQVSVENYKKDKERLGPEKFEKLKKESQKQKFLTGGQAKLAAKAPPPNKLDEKDFKVLREEKAKGRGMGLQDEKVKTGKVKPVKAVLGLAAMGLMGAKYLKDKNKKATPMIGAAAELMKKKKELLGKKMGGVMKAKMGVATDYKKYLKGLKKATDSVKKDKENKFLKRRMQLMGMPKLSKGGGADSGRIGEMKSRLAVAQDKLAGGFRKARGKVSPRDYDKITERTKTYALAQSMKDKDRLTDRDIKKASSLVKGKMGGGMMQKPMGYSKGVSVKARGCKLGRTKPTKIT